MSSDIGSVQDQRRTTALMMLRDADSIVVRFGDTALEGKYHGIVEGMLVFSDEEDDIYYIPINNINYIEICRKKDGEEQEGSGSDEPAEHVSRTATLDRKRKMPKATEDF